MLVLPHVRYSPAPSAEYFVRLLDRVLRTPRPARRFHFGRHRPPPSAEESLMHSVPRFILGLSGNHAQRIADGRRVKEVPLRRGDVIFFPPLGWNAPAWNGPLEFLSTVFYPDHSRLVHGRWSGAGKPHVTYYHTPTAISGAPAHLLSALTAASGERETTHGVQAMIDALLWELRYALASSQEALPGKGRQTWRAIANYVQEHLHHPLSLGMVAERFELHPNHISRLFRHTGKEGFVDYITRLRMERAELLLLEGASDIESIALACGFTECGYFRRVFRSFFGHAPSAHLDRQRE